jgi:hypothetical protein
MPDVGEATSYIEVVRLPTLITEYERDHKKFT